jgi:hypothetical protein
MSVIRWLFGRSGFNRLDPGVLAMLYALAVTGQMPVWGAILIGFMWMIVSVIIELALFGDGYHDRSNAAQRKVESPK